MKIILFLVLFLNSAYAEEKLCTSKENASEYYFINGIWNNNEVKTKELSQKLSDKLNLDEVILLYNVSEGFIADLEETFSLISLSLKKEDNKKTFFSDKKYRNVYSSFYKRLSSDKINMIISHSEGNLFSEQLCINNSDNKIIENISIAPPLKELKCNSFKTYVLFDNDKVITQIEKINKNFYHLSPTHKGQGLVSHSLNSYLDDKNVVSHINSGISKTINKTYKDNFSFNIAEIEIKEDNKLENLLNQAKDAKESLELWGREKQAFLNVVSYSSDLASNLNKKGFIQKILNAEIPAQDEQEFADMIAYSLNSLNSYCKSVFPPKLIPLCSKVGVKNYFKSSEYLAPLLVFNKSKDWKMLLPCNIAAESVNAKFPISLEFQKRLPTVLYNQESIDIEYEIKNDKLNTIDLGVLSILEDNNQNIKTVFEPSKNNNIDRKDFKDKITQCNSLSKLASSNCKLFLKHIEETYFSKN